ncbi:HPr kinase [Rhodovulum sp. PH10]|uniref:HPr kinase/phosphorylase n=1 Tax=Rhodovulum sp. PH10 TaxID=1187851 RepID=UPI00027C24FA|nr:HPr kinase/phosphatase C-terminal domain-containing protein [Rhodovulum sp. PH10]EJW12303.1 HPr kinase [Rhodovulum sp. PH10]
MTPTIHATTVLVGRRAVLIRGAAGAGKSTLALRLLEATPGLPFVRLVADDRTAIAVAGGRLLAAPADPLAGLIEVRGLGIRTLPYEPVAVVGLVVDLATADAERLPEPAGRVATILGIQLRRLGVHPGHDPLPGVLSALAEPPIP